MRDEPMEAMIRHALAALSPYGKSLRERGWDASLVVEHLEVVERPHAYRVQLVIDLPRKGVPIEMTETSQSPDQEDTMNPGIDAEGPAEIGAYLREYGWQPWTGGDGSLWAHPRLPNLPPITMTAAVELQREALVAVTRRDPAGPSRVH